eukprot:Amastigsp_a841602_93.p2 type:complete len:344 gc:universal Amastigsp_a841602_93:73-1104(+)
MKRAREESDPVSANKKSKTLAAEPAIPVTESTTAMADDGAGKKFLLAFDGSEHSRRARAYLLSTMRSEDSVVIVTVVHGGDDVAIEPSVFLSETEKGALAEYVRAQRVRAEEQLAESKALFDARALSAKTALVSGPDAKAALLDAAAEHGADVIAMGSRGLGTISRLLLGSVSEYIVHNAHRSVLIVKGAAPLEPEAPRKRSALCAIDDSAHSKLALQTAVDISALGDTLYLLSVHVPFIGLHDDLAALWGDPNARNVKCAEALVHMEQTYVPQITEAGLQCTALFRQGDARAIICEEAESKGVDLVVCGARGAGRLERLLMGSVSTYVVEHAAVPAVLVVKA